MATRHLRQAIAHRVQEVLVRVKNDAIQVKGDHGLGSANGCDLSGMVRGLDHGGRDVGRVFHDPFRTAVLIEYRIIRGFDPNLAATLAATRKLRRNILPRSKLTPELYIIVAISIGSIDKHGVMFANNLVRFITNHA